MLSDVPIARNFNFQKALKTDLAEMIDKSLAPKVSKEGFFMDLNSTSFALLISRYI